MDQPRKFRFNKRAIDALPPQDRDARAREAEYGDTEVPGLKLLVSKGGRKFYYLRYSHQKRRKAAKIGEHGPTTVQEARKRANDMRALLDRGIDPQQEKNDVAGAMTLAEFAENEYLPHARTNNRSFRMVESRLRTHILPRFGEVRLPDITTKDVQALHNKLVATRAPATANRCLSLLRRMLRLAVDWGHIDKNPVAAVSKHQENNARHRYLSDDEIGRFLAALKVEPNRVAAAALTFLLLTGARKQEALDAMWKDVDLDKGMWFIPDTKAGKSRHVVLNGQAMNVVRDMHRIPGNPYIFPGKVPGRPLNNPFKAFRRVIDSAGIGDFRIHDLRHTFASIVVNNGVGLYEVQRLLGHASSQTTQRYAHLGEEQLRSATGKVADAVGRAASG